MAKKPPPVAKLRVTFLCSRGIGTHINIQPDVEFVAYYGTFREAAQRLAREGVYLERGGHCTIDRYIPGGAIIEIAPAEEIGRIEYGTAPQD